MHLTRCHAVLSPESPAPTASSPPRHAQIIAADWPVVAPMREHIACAGRSRINNRS